MGLLNNWLKKKQKEQLEKTGEKSKSIVLKKEETAKREKAGEISKEQKEEKAASQTHPAKAKLPSQSIADKVLLRPLVTEKSAIAESVNKYSFVVAKRMNKQQIKKAVEDLYGIKPIAVNIFNVPGRQIRFGRIQGRRSDYKKAVVTLPPGKSIDIHTGV